VGICEQTRLACCSCSPCLLLSAVLVSLFSFLLPDVCHYPRASALQAPEKACCVWYVVVVWRSLTPDYECSRVVRS
jgi:hypothetical protein